MRLGYDATLYAPQKDERINCTGEEERKGGEEEEEKENTP
jgi:hypothetical protein